MIDLTPFYNVRDSLVETLVADLIGPASEDEVICDPPMTQYVSGILYARRAGEASPGPPVSPENDVDLSDGDEETGGLDASVSLANIRYPASFGMSFAVDGHDTTAIVVSVSTAQYAQVQPPAPEIGAVPSEMAWRRTPLRSQVTVPIARVGQDYVDVGIPGLQLYRRVRQPDPDGRVPITLILVNTLVVPSEEVLGDAYAFFQATITVTGVNASDTPFVERHPDSPATGDDDLRSYRLLYRHAQEFAVGHGCSVRWETDGERTGHARLLATTSAPCVRVPVATNGYTPPEGALEMRTLARGNRSDVVQLLSSICRDYEQWISDRRTDLLRDKELDAQQRAIGTEHLRSCTEAAERMNGGVQLLETRNDIFQAFQLMNEVMLKQRARTEWLRLKLPRPSHPEEGQGIRWRPFQLAFILLVLRGIADETTDDRSLVDLLWFPTGGGKTEAYLGITALTVFLRRLRNPRCSGVTALMRYTLRLLTIQQFERAALMICCCEAVRRDRAHLLGEEPVSLGLWLGRGGTPNTLDEAKRALRRLRDGNTLEEGNPVQLHRCPWCGSDLSHENYRVSDRLTIACGASGCSFANGLPVHIIDEDIYNCQPSLVIATVDKFALLPWRPEVGRLFNRGPGTPRDMRPPELIIQDELHLISGPLGSLVGLYETAVDVLCTDGSLVPKVIASTATIRRAASQVRGLFGRSVFQFPPPALDAQDSFFARSAGPEERPDRMYVGLTTAGTSHTTLMVRVYAALLQAAARADIAPAIVDPYWTLVGYFNSLRVLGGARMQVEDDIPERVGLLANTRSVLARDLSLVVELNSRRASSEIPTTLHQIGFRYGSGEGDPIDVLLATNMISVGVDVDRLGLMVVMGQPQSTAEYIQCTSRIGRQYPGLVVVLLNSARARDRSHFESFPGFHQALYRGVEATSVTPFSARARDRGLHAVLVSLARIMDPELRDKAGACDSLDAHLRTIVELITPRVSAATSVETDATRAQLDQLVESWVTAARENRDLVYRDEPGRVGLLCDPTEEPGEGNERWPTPWSLRDVDVETRLYLVPENRDIQEDA